MHDDFVLEAIEASLRSPTFCSCGESMTVAVHDNAAWLECAKYARPSSVPPRLTGIIRSLLHDRCRIIELPDTERLAGTGGLEPALG